MKLSSEEKNSILRELNKADKMSYEDGIWHAQCLLLTIIDDKDIYNAYVKIVNKSKIFSKRNNP